VFTFHRPETFQKWLKEEKTLRARLFDIPTLQTDGLRDCQITAVSNLAISLGENRPKALIEMATGKYVRTEIEEHKMRGSYWCKIDALTSIHFSW